MGILLPVCSAAHVGLMPSPAPQSLLESVASCGTASGIKSTQNLIAKSGALKIFMDNGMFTVHGMMEEGQRVIFDDTRPIYPEKNTINITAVHNIECAIALKPDVMIVPDMPVPKLRKVWNKYDYGDEELCFLKATYHNIIRAKETNYLRQKFCPDVELYFAFQGYNIGHLHRIMSEVNGLKFDGFCLATRALSWNKLLAIMMLLKCYGARKIHILAGSTMPVMAIGAFAARHLFDEVSYDSHNWLFYSLKGSFRFYGSMDAVQLVQHNATPENVLSMRCDCPHCKGRSLYDIRAMDYVEEKQHLLAQHNYYIETETANAYFNHSETPTMLKDFLLLKSHRTGLIQDIYQALSASYEMKNYLDNMKFVNGLADFIFNAFKKR
jgi:hypothetical protein